MRIRPLGCLWYALTFVAGMLVAWLAPVWLP